MSFLPNYKTFHKTAYPLQGNIDKNGNKTVLPSLEKADLNTCATLCNNLTNCVGFSTDGEYCWLKNSDINEPIYRSNVSSYIKNTNTNIQRAIGTYDVYKIH